ncbi:MAG TPA: T9SS type A sorting domain-containing protein [Flavisolibacter sp.]|jgi:hypothetical protein
MYQSLRTLLSTTRKVSLLVIASLSSFLLLAQSGSSGQVIPELVFQNPVLLSGVAGQDGATYKFSNVAEGIDAALTIKSRSASNVVLTSIDLTSHGWTKALQPQLGIAGNVPANQNWWMQFEMKFLKAGTSDAKKVKGFKVTALDVDGDGGTIREYVQMEKVKSVAFSPVTSLLNAPLLVLSNVLGGNEGSGYNLLGLSKMVQGPTTNATNIDTAATAFMATFDYEEKDVISFTLGAKSGNSISDAGERMSSLWFKAFSLAPPLKILPVRMASFAASLQGSAVSLDWSTQSEVAFSHFVVERSTNGKDWKDIATVFSMGGQGGQKGYAYKDKNVTAANVLYYRLRLVDDSKETAYTSIKVIRLGREEGKTPQISVYPNPVQDALRVTLPSEWQNKAVVIEVYNSAGIRVKSSRFASAGQTENIIMTDVSKGFYLVKATNENVTTQLSIIKN